MMKFYKTQTKEVYLK